MPAVRIPRKSNTPVNSAKTCSQMSKNSTSASKKTPPTVDMGEAMARITASKDTAPRIPTAPTAAPNLPRPRLVLPLALLELLAQITPLNTLSTTPLFPAEILMRHTAGTRTMWRIVSTISSKPFSSRLPLRVLLLLPLLERKPRPRHHRLVEVRRRMGDTITWVFGTSAFACPWLIWSRCRHRLVCKGRGHVV